jgi:RNA polymerase sigma-70 factor (ECF subfamily)
LINILYKKACRTNNTKEEEMLYAECHMKLYNTSLRILNDRMDAEEVMHDTLLKYLSENVFFRTKNERDRWLARVCINLSIDRLRKRMSEKRIFNDPDYEEHIKEMTSEQELNQADGFTVESVKKAMSNLADGYRLILSLHLFEGYDFQEIAQITKLKEVSVRTQYIRGKERLASEVRKITGITR